MRRSSSTSHIPLPRNDFRPRSKSSVRSSIKDAGNSAKKIIRTGSVEKLVVPGLKRSVSSTTLKKTYSTTPTLQSSRPSVKSSGNTITPASARSASRSPYRIGSAQRNVNDKKWIAEQFIKVRCYLQKQPNCPEHVPDMLKPPTMETFVFVINLLFKEIDPHLEINKANYKEEVLRRLKLMRFPGTISSSLMKTVNTMHAWPQVVCIFAWLVDLISVINPEQPVDSGIKDDIKLKKVECVLNYVIHRYSLYNEGGNEKSADVNFTEQMENVLNIRSNEIDQKIDALNREIKELSNLKERQMQQLKEIENKNNVMKKELDDLEYEIDTFYEEDELKQKEIVHVINDLKERKNRLNEDIKRKQENITNLKEKIKNQPCTYEEKCKLLVHNDELKHTLDLKKESLVAKKTSKNQRDLKLIELKKEIETNIYRLNKQLVEITVIKPELKVLQLCETGFTAKEYRNEIKRVLKNKETFENQINKKIDSLQNNKIKNVNVSLLQQIEDYKNEIKKLLELENQSDENIAKYNLQITTVMKESENCIKIIMEKVKKLDENTPDIDSLKEELKEVTELAEQKQINLENVMKETLTFFEKLNTEFMDQLENMNEIRTAIFDHLNGCVTNIYIEEGNILKDLNTLLQFRVEN